MNSLKVVNLIAAVEKSNLESHSCRPCRGHSYETFYGLN